MKRVLISFIAFLIFSVQGISVQANESQILKDKKILAEFSIAKGGDIILLPVTFKGKEYSFLFDTGCTATCLDLQFKVDLGKPKRIQEVLSASGKTLPQEVFDAPDAFVGTFNLKDCNEVSCADLKDLGMMAGKPVSGILGMNWLKNYIVQINFDEGRLYFLNPMDSDKSQWGTPIPFNDNKLHMPVISGNIPDGITIKYKPNFSIDSGANRGTLEFRIFRDILKTKKVKTSSSVSQTLGGTVSSPVFCLENIFIGRFNYRGLIFDEGTWSILGLDFLSRHVVTFDFPGHKLYLKEGKEFNRIDQFNMSGLGLVRKDGLTSVFLVYETSE